VEAGGCREGGGCVLYGEETLPHLQKGAYSIRGRGEEKGPGEPGERVSVLPQLQATTAGEEVRGGGGGGAGGGCGAGAGAGGPRARSALWTGGNSGWIVCTGARESTAGSRPPMFQLWRWVAVRH